VAGITYDTGALLAAERNARELWALHKAILGRGLRPTVPAGVLAQAWRGGPQAGLSRLLKGCRIESMDEPLARAAGDACRRCGTADVIDAALVVGALARRDMVVTSDPVDVERIASGLAADLQIHRV
jgi:hypothetical protein